MSVVLGVEHCVPGPAKSDEVFIKRSGSAVVLIPRVHSWDSLMGSLGKFSGDYMAARDQPRQRRREAAFE